MKRTEFVEVVRRYYESHRQELYTYALALTRRRQAAEDVVHTVFCKLLARGRPPRDMGPYLFRSVRNAAIDELSRRGNAKPRESIFETPAPETDPALGLWAEEALDSLGDDERETIVLKLYAGMTFKEIATTRRVSINTAASWYRRGLEKLRTAFKEDDHEGR